MKAYKPVPTAVNMFAMVMDMGRIVGVIRKGQGQLQQTRKMRMVFVLYEKRGQYYRKVISVYPYKPEAKCTYDFLSEQVLN